MKSASRLLLLVLVAVLGGCASSRVVKVKAVEPAGEPSFEVIEVFDTGPVR